MDELSAILRLFHRRVVTVIDSDSEGPYNTWLFEELDHWAISDGSDQRLDVDNISELRIDSYGRLSIHIKEGLDDG